MTASDSGSTPSRAPERPTRLAAIVFTDIVGYSRMMEQDEARTIAVLERHNEIVLPLVDRSNGEVIDAIGDGLFILFPSVREAVVCAMAIQNAVAAYDQEVRAEEQFSLRIGVHLGEIWHDGERAFGNGVNVAARVQPKALPGGICITEDVYRQVANKLSQPIESIGVHELKNISRRMELYRVVTGHESADARRDDGGELDAIKQRILRERERIANRRDDADASSFEHRIESKVYSIVERVMDTAISKWDQMPEEKKARAIARVQEEIEKDGDVQIRLGGKDDGEERKKGGSGEVVSRISTGLVFGVGFGIGYFGYGIAWMIWPFALFGVLPVASGLVKAVRELAASERRRRERPLELERELLRTARDTGGCLTVVQASSETGIPLDEVQAALDRMAAKGYVIQQLRDSGVVEYEFPSLASRTGRPTTD